MTESDVDVVDLAFAVSGDWLPRAYRGWLAAALRDALPWIAQDPAIGVHRLNLSAGSGAQALLSHRTRLTLRLTRAQAAGARCLSGQRLQIGERTLGVGDALERELLPFHTLYAHMVTSSESGNDELAFQDAVQAEISARGLACRAIFGRHQTIDGSTLHGAPVMLDGLSPPMALRIMQQGLGPHRLLGCGVFVPHKSAAAVGA